MVSVRATKQTLGILILALLIISIVLKIASGIAVQPAVIDTVLSDLEISYYGISLMAASSTLVLASKILDAVVPPLIAFLLATMFVELISGLNIKERLAKSRVAKMENHVIIVPANGLAKALGKELGLAKIGSVVIARTRKELDSVYEDNLLGIMGEVGSADSLAMAGLKKALCVVACSDDDMRNALTALTAKSKRSDVRVISLVNKAEDTDKMTSIGVQTIVAPEVTVGKDVAKKIIKRSFASASMKE